MKVIFLLFSISLQISLYSFSQINKDSLLNCLNVAKEDTTKVLLLLNIADAFETNNQDSANYYLREVKQLSEKLNFTNGLYKYYQQSAILSFTIGDYTLAMEQSKVALDLAITLGDTGLIINSLANTGIVFQYLGKFDSQLEFSLQALTMIERRHEYKKLSSMYHNVGNAYYNLRQYQKCIDYSMLALSTQAKYGGSSYTNRILASLGNGYSQLYQYDSAIYYFRQASAESKKVNDKYADAMIMGEMVNLYANTFDFDSLLSMAKNSVALAEELQSRQMMTTALRNLAYANYLNDNHEQARKYIDDAVEIAKSDSLINELKNSYIVLSYIASRSGDYKTSVWSKATSDSLNSLEINEEVLSKTSEMQEKYEAEKRNNQILLQQNELRQKNLLNYFLFAAFAMLLLLSVISYRNFLHRQRLQNQRIDKLETEKKLMATEAVLKGEEQERTRLAKDLHDGLGGMLSGIKYSFSAMKKNLIMTPENQLVFERSIDMLDSCTKEMRRVAHNMMPESLVKFGLGTAIQDFCNDINESGALQITFLPIGLDKVLLDQTMAITIYRIVQELMNNILKHAAAKSAIVQLSNSDGHFTITVEDDGKGFDTAILNKSKGIGWTNIQHRVDFLKGNIDINSQPEKGTSVQIDFNI